MRNGLLGVLGVLGVLICGLSALPAATIGDQNSVPVRVLRLPDGAIQPQVAVDAAGVVHVVYLSGPASGSDVFYTRVTQAGEFAKPIRVNSQAGSAIATGTVRGARIAVGRGVIHIAWNGSDRALPKAPGNLTPMLYSRLTTNAETFEAQRNLVQHAVGLDGGGAIAADAKGNVFVLWHAGGPESRGEGDRRVWLASSSDDGRTFARERPISPAETGACGCCGMDAVIDRTGGMFVLYRSARDVVNRDNYLLTSVDEARSFQPRLLQSWNIGACPMSTYDLAASDQGTFASWEAAGQVQFARVGATNAGAIHAPDGSARNRRHPSLAVDQSGHVLLVWSEGTAWQRGGAVAWQLFDPDGTARGTRGRVDGLPVWGLAAAAYAPRQGLVVIY